jgi:uncharacterized integral membrane protein
VEGKPPPAPAERATESAPPRPPRRTRTSVAFNALLASLVVLILLLVFILENTQRVKISYFGADGHLPLGVALLLAAVAGGLLVALVGVGRILQLRRDTKRLRDR